MISKEIFCQVIENLRKQMLLDRKNGKIIQEMFGCGSRCSYDDNLLVKSIMLLLQVHFPKDEDGFCRIEYFCEFMEFGKFESNEIISAEDLYETLISELKSNG